MLDYVALGILIFAALTLFYGIIVIHDIPYEIAEHRKHPHSDAIHIAGWVSLMTLHVLWPFLWIWATLYREDRGWGFSHNAGNSANPIPGDSPQLEQLQTQVTELSDKVAALEGQADTVGSINTLEGVSE